MAVTQAVILCGGFGTRMGELVKDTPKPMLPIAGIPLLEHVLTHLAKHGVTDIILSAHYKAEVIERHFAAYIDGGNTANNEEATPTTAPVQQKTRVRVVIEEEPLGTAGPLHLAAPYLDETFLVVYGDEFLDFDVTALTRDHLEHKPLLTILARPSHHPWDGHLIQTDKAGNVTSFVREFNFSAGHQNLGNLGMYVCDKRILEHIPKHKCGFAEDIFPALIAAHEGIRVHVIESNGYVKDVANAARIAEVETYLRRHELIENARHTKKPIAVALLDRDGVIVEDTDLVKSEEELKLLPGAAQAIAQLNSAGITTIIVTNQPQVARGLITEEQLAAINERLSALLAEHGARIDATYYCPHHPETQYAEGVLKLRRGCDCRKPRPGMLLQAVEEHNLDLATCVMIGDSSDDIEAGYNAGVRTILLRTGKGRVRAGTPQPDETYDSLLDAVTALLAQRT